MGQRMCMRNLGKADADVGARSGLGSERSQLRRRVARHLARESQRVAVRQHGIVALVSEVSEVEVVDDLGHQVGEALDESDPGIGVTRYAQ